MALMKKSYLRLMAVGILLAIYGGSMAQSWFPVGATWYYYTYASDPLSSPGQNTRLEVLKDTTVNGVNCKLITGEYYFVYSSTHTNSGALPNIYAYERNDSVYFLQNDSFRLTYDFSLPVGDSINMFAHFASICSRNDTESLYHIDSAGTDIVNGAAIKYYYASNRNLGYPVVGTGDFKAMERIGSNEFLYPTYDCFIDASFPILTCYTDTVIGTYQPDPGMPCFPVYTAVNDLLNPDAIQIFPNPAIGYTTVTIDNSLLGAQYVLTDVEGRIIVSGAINAAQYHLQTNNLTNGIYLLHLRHEAVQLCVKKLMIE